MIEGVRLLPWLQQATRRDPVGVAYLNDCEACMRERSKDLRQSMRCGFEPALDDPRASATWRADGFSGFDGLPGGLASTCPGYTVHLPEVREVSWLHLWWSKGQLRDKLGAAPSETVQMLVETLSAENSAAEAYEMQRARDEQSKGGR